MIVYVLFVHKKSVSKRKICIIFIKIKNLKDPKKTQKSFLVGFFRWVFWWDFLGGIFWVGFYCQPCLCRGCWPPAPSSTTMTTSPPPFFRLSCCCSCAWWCCSSCCSSSAASCCVLACTSTFRSKRLLSSLTKPRGAALRRFRIPPLRGSVSGGVGGERSRGSDSIGDGVFGSGRIVCSSIPPPPMLS